ncbi:MAG: hypothetical protein PHS86_02030 [Syntrophaceae bacterium]|nr:hypothetical protein [Syntrophaceae bacterium]
MLSKDLTPDAVARLLDFESLNDFNSFLQEVDYEGKQKLDQAYKFTVGEGVILKLALILSRVGVEMSKVHSYSDAILGSFITKGWNDFHKLVEDDNQELCCLIEDNQLARIFLRSKDTGREYDVGAVKPVLLPTTRCEINVTRAIRPVIYSIQKMEK